jgi:hypothetical protein
VVKTWDISTGLCKASLCTPAQGIDLRDVWLIDGRVVFGWYAGQKIHLWDTRKGELL